MMHHYRKIPPKIKASLSNIKTGLVAVGGAMVIDKNQLNPILKRLRIDWNVGQDLTGKRDIVIPDERLGGACMSNKLRHKIIRNDLRKIAVLKPVYAPVWGGHRKWQMRTYREYPRDVKEARRQFLEIFIESDKDARVLVKFRLSELLNPKNPRFERLLIESLNIAQEVFGCRGCCDVYPAEDSLDSYRSKIRVNWTILPVGTKPDKIWSILTANGNVYQGKDKEKEFKERYDFLMSFKGTDLIVGAESFERYFGIKISDDLVVFDCLNYGNAMYIFRKDWEVLSKKSRVELLSGYESKDFYRIAHKKNWEHKAKTIIDHLLTNYATMSN